MPFPFKKAGNAQHFAAQMAWDCEAHAGEANELDTFIENVGSSLKGPYAEYAKEEMEHLQRLNRAAPELRDAQKQAAQQVLHREYALTAGKKAAPIKCDENRIPLPLGAEEKAEAGDGCQHQVQHEAGKPVHPG
jgi:hypothetical protein